ncbi:MAG: cobalt ECF transporter T component CbiQ [Desulfosarcinaceae bacterium]|nr:cobalt ECF transporter T component CbiQ [Desulfosarcinaceae bacterium]
MIAEPFARGSSRLHQLDPRIRVVAASGLSLVVALSHQLPTLIAALLAGVGLVVLANLPLMAVAKRLSVVTGFLLLLWLVLPFTMHGDPMFNLGPFTATREGLSYAGRITFKSLAILLLFLAMVTTMSVATLGHTLARLRLPDKLIVLLLLTYRYLFVLEQEYQRLKRAADIRGFRPGTDLHSYRTFAYLVGMLLVRASARARRVYLAMCCRGFNGRFYTLTGFSPDAQQLPLTLLLGVIGILLLLLEMKW